MTINRVYRPEPRSSRGNTSSNQQVSALIPRHDSNEMEMFQRHGSNYTPTPVLLQHPLRNQCIRYYICSREVFGINHFELRNVDVVAIECFVSFFFATIDRASIMARMNRRSAMIYGSLRGEFMETNHNDHIYRYGTHSFGNILFMCLNRNTMIIKYFIYVINITGNIAFNEGICVCSIWFWIGFLHMDLYIYIHQVAFT